MLNDLQRFEYAEIMLNMTDPERIAFLAEHQVTEPTDLAVLSNLIKEIKENRNDEDTNTRTEENSQGIQADEPTCQVEASQEEAIDVVAEDPEVV